MYITAFYSFKGGVGRSMALVNVAVELANRGRGVLVVDFDLEAPGLDTFDVTTPRDPVPGMVDFVSEYLDSGQAPDAARFVSETPADFGDTGGRLWIMPSGRHATHAQRATYAQRLSQIDWGALYAERDGYLLFEDLKEQWRQAFNPDYVLIDSRTGHTDVGGICTRQLPDAVVILFFPNEQNLRGLTRVVRDIRSESDEPRNKDIELHFVMSNVPDLDDEDSILDDKIKAFQSQLGFRRDLLRIHRYDSLSLLNQVVFTKDRPRSRLAQEYAELVCEISRLNPDDRDGALDYISPARGRLRIRGESIQSRDVMLDKIEKAHPTDGEVLYRLAVLRERDGETAWASAIASRAIAAGYAKPEVFLQRSRSRAQCNDAGGAEQDALEVLQFPHLRPPMVREALSRIRSQEPERVANAVAVTSLEPHDQKWLADGLDRSFGTMRIAIPIWERLIDCEELSPTRREQARQQLILCHIGTGGFSNAMRMLEGHDKSIKEMTIQDAFNFGMASWGNTGEITKAAFSHVVELDQAEVISDRNPNYFQCMAIAYWATGDRTEAARYTDEAQRALDAMRWASEFTCWRYCRVSADDFVADLEDIRLLVRGVNPPTPPFMNATGRTDGSIAHHYSR